MLDETTAATVREAVLQVTEGRTLIVVEHRIEAWLSHVDRVIVLGSGGVVISDGTVDAFLAGPAPAGVWMPGMAVPEPLEVPDSLVRPGGDAVTVSAVDVSVDLIARTLRGTQRTRAVENLTAELVPGQVTGFTGASGAGKSTALAALGGLIAPAAGVITPNLARLKSRALAGVMGWVPQNPEHGFLTTTASDEVRHTSLRLGLAVDELAVLEVFGLARLAGAHPYRLSGGEQRRLALAAALAHRPGLALLDEPTVGQDPGTWAAVTGWIAAARGAGAAVGVSTHAADLPLDVQHRLTAGVLR